MAAFVLGNGVSRAAVDVDLLLRLGAVYGCNALYRTHAVTALVATDRPIAEAIQNSGYSLEHRFYTRRPLPNTGAQAVPRPYFGFSSGPIALALLLQKTLIVVCISWALILGPLNLGVSITCSPTQNTTRLAEQHLLLPATGSGR
jgi:hypothetical protein